MNKPTDDHFASSVRWIVRNGIGIQVMETLAVGAFLTAFAVQLGASNFVIGLLAAIPSLSQLAQVPALALVERNRNRSQIYFWSGLVARPALLVIAAAAFVPDPNLALVVIVAAFTVRYIAGAYLGCSWNSWMRDLVPDDQMGVVFGRRQKQMIFIGAVLSLFAAGFIDLWHRLVGLPEKYGFAAIYALSFLGGAYSVYCARRVYEPPMAAPTTETHWVELLRTPFRNENFRRLMIFLGSWNFAVNLATPFFTVHMLKRLDLDLTVIVALGTLSQFAAYLMVTQWGAIADRFSNKSVLAVCAPLFIACIFLWTFTMFPEKHALTMPLLIGIHIATGIASAGVTLASGNIALKLAPRGNATSYLAASAVLNSAAAGIASMLGGMTADFFVSRELQLIAHWHAPLGDREFNALSFEHWDFFFLFATMIGLYALHRLSLVEEHGEVEERVVIDALFGNVRRGLRNLSAFAGLKPGNEFPMEALRRESAKRDETTP